MAYDDDDWLTAPPRKWQTVPLPEMTTGEEMLAVAESLSDAQIAALAPESERQPVEVEAGAPVATEPHSSEPEYVPWTRRSARVPFVARDPDRMVEAEGLKTFRYHPGKGWEPWQGRLLRALAKFGNLSRATQEAKVPYGRAKAWERLDPIFAEAIQAAISWRVDKIEGKALDMAEEGDGEMVRFVLKKRKAPIYGDKVEVSGNVLHVQAKAEDVLDVLAALNPGVIAPALPVEAEIVSQKQE